MNIPRDFPFEQPAAVSDGTPESGPAATSVAWKAVDERLRRYLDLLGTPQSDALREECLRRARRRMSVDDSDPMRVAFEELHGLLAERQGGARSDFPARDSVAARLGGPDAIVRSAPPIRLEHMVPERRPVRTAPHRRASGPLDTPLRRLAGSGK